MLRALWIITGQSFLLLRRDRIFLPVLIVSVLITGFANMASWWSIEDFAKILFDVGFFGLQLVGSFVAVIWGTKAVADSRQEGSLEVQLASPVSRPVWLLGKYLGLCLCLLAMAAAILVIWQAGMLLNDFGWMTRPQLGVYAYLVVGWLVVAALGFFFSACSGQAVALFATVCAWITGLIAAPVSSALGAETPAPARELVHFFARYWDFQQFNLIDWAIKPALPPLADLIDRAAYGGLLGAVLISAACLTFAKRDLLA